MAFDPASHRRKRRALQDRGETRREGTLQKFDSPASFFLYVEGPRDGEILRLWSRRESPTLVRSLERCTIILGGRQPDRAVDHFRNQGGPQSGQSGLVLLDRDHHVGEGIAWAREPGLEVFTWSRRHIESYLLVRDAIARLLDDDLPAGSVAEVMRTHIPPPDAEDIFRELDAKRLLGANGVLARELGRPISAAEIARTMRPDELHADVRALLQRIRVGLGVSPGTPEVVRRPRGSHR